MSPWTSTHIRDRQPQSWLSRPQQVMAACLAGGEMAAASHRIASALSNLGTFDAPIEISTRYERYEQLVRHREAVIRQLLAVL
jgi:hypothetical protein